MAKKGMKRMSRTHTQPRNEQAAVPEIEGKAKSGKEKAKPIIAGTAAPALKVYHSVKNAPEREISPSWKAVDNDLARDNLENDLTAADIQDV